MRVAPASIEFSISSLTTEAGRSTTSPAAILLATCSESTWIRPMAGSRSRHLRGSRLPVYYPNMPAAGLSGTPATRPQDDTGERIAILLVFSSPDTPREADKNEGFRQHGDSGLTSVAGRSTIFAIMPIPLIPLALGALFGATANKKGKEQFQAVKGRKKKDGTTGKAYSGKSQKPNKQPAEITSYGSTDCSRFTKQLGGRFVRGQMNDAKWPSTAHRKGEYERSRPPSAQSATTARR